LAQAALGAVSEAEAPPWHISNELLRRMATFRTRPAFDDIPALPLPMSAPGVPMSQSVSYDALYGPPSGRKVI